MTNLYLHAFHKNISVVRKLYFNHIDRRKKIYKEVKIKLIFDQTD